jgi:hypothetical protein
VECSTGKAMQIKANALAELMGRLKIAASPASRCFLVALFLFGFSSSYFDDLRSNTDPQSTRPNANATLLIIKPLLEPPRDEPNEEAVRNRPQ